MRPGPEVRAERVGGGEAVTGEEWRSWRNRLERARAMHEDRAAALERALGRSLREQTGEIALGDQHAADLGTETAERGKDLGLLARHRQIAAACEEAMARLEAGRFGICVDCGSPVGKERLMALPWAERCVRCQEEAESAMESRPPEEEELDLLFQRAFGGGESAGYDGEDVWRELERHETANPAPDE